MTDFRGHLQKQLTFLERSCSDYDGGAVDEAVRIAMALRVMFHDTTKSTSILRHMKAHGIKLLSTAVPFADAKVIPDVPSLYLVHLRAEVPELKCWAEPLLDSNFGGQLVGFSQWWSRDVVIDLKKGHGTLTRKQLVLEAANTDGGAHVGDKLDARYQKAMEGAGLSIEVTFKNGLPTKQATFHNIHYATLRQIGYEVLRSPEVLSLAGTTKS